MYAELSYLDNSYSIRVPDNLKDKLTHCRLLNEHLFMVAVLERYLAQEDSLTRYKFLAELVGIPEEETEDFIRTFKGELETVVSKSEIKRLGGGSWGG